MNNGFAQVFLLLTAADGNISVFIRKGSHETQTGATIPVKE